MSIRMALAFWFLPFVLAAQAEVPAALTPAVKGLPEELARFMMGSFSSAEQSKLDPKNFTDKRSTT